MIAPCPAFSLALHPFKLSPFFLKNSKSRQTLTLTLTLTHPSAAQERSIDPKTPTKHPNRRKSSSYGTSRRSAIKKAFSQEQVTFTTPLSNNPSIAIIGGGLSGLLCASTLEQRGIRSTLFDTGIHGLGGRMATREVLDSQQNLVFDHAAQFFTARDARFQILVDKWLSEGLVGEWKGLIGELEAGGRFTSIRSSQTKYVAVGGMRLLADSICEKGANFVEIARPCWISKLEPYNGMWHLSEKDEIRGSFDAIVIAHNGKCANRLLSSSGLPRLFRQMKKLELSSIWALIAAFEDALPVPFEGAFVKGVESVSWLCNNTSKLSLQQSINGGHQCWTFFSTASYGKRNKVPQENIPNVTAEKVRREMLDGVETALGLCKGSLPLPFYTRVQLWGAALPANTLGVPCIFDPYGRAGICGDWLLGSSMEAAALSGISLGNHMADYFQSGGSHLEEFAVGLDEEFEAVSGYDIGDFPGLNSNELVSRDLECVV